MEKLSYGIYIIVAGVRSQIAELHLGVDGAEVSDGFVKHALHTVELSLDHIKDFCKNVQSLHGVQTAVHELLSAFQMRQMTVDFTNQRLLELSHSILFAITDLQFGYGLPVTQVVIEKDGSPCADLTFALPNRSDFQNDLLQHRRAGSKESTIESVLGSIVDVLTEAVNNSASDTSNKANKPRFFS